MTLDQNTERDFTTPTQSALDSDTQHLISISKDSQAIEDGKGDFAELLDQLNDADGVAKSVEKRLDEVLGTLDRLLKDLENDHTDDKAAQKDKQG